MPTDEFRDLGNCWSALSEADCWRGEVPKDAAAHADHGGGHDTSNGAYRGNSGRKPLIKRNVGHDVRLQLPH